MIRFFTSLFIASICLGLWACKKTPLVPEATKTEEKDYRAMLENNRERMQDDRNLDTLNRAIRQFQTHMGRSPTNLPELVKYNYIPQIPEAGSGLQFVFEQDTANVRTVRMSPEQRSRLAQQRLQAELSNKAATSE